MSLKAGRVGVAPDQVDEFGKINSDATQGYTKQEADAKFETKTNAASIYETKSDAANLQPKTLAVPISMLSGSKLTVESALQGLNTDKIDDNIVSGTITSDFTIDSTQTSLKKYGKLVVLSAALNGVTLDAYTSGIFTIPEGFRPSHMTPLAMVVGSNGLTRCTLLTEGPAQSSVQLNNQNVYVSGSWLV